MKYYFLFFIFVSHLGCQSPKVAETSPKTTLSPKKNTKLPTHPSPITKYTWSTSSKQTELKQPTSQNPYQVNIGTFSKFDNAQKLVKTLKSKKITTKYKALPKKDQTLYTVYISDISSLGIADQKAKQVLEILKGEIEQVSISKNNKFIKLMSSNKSIGSSYPKKKDKNKKQVQTFKKPDSKTTTKTKSAKRLNSLNKSPSKQKKLSFEEQWKTQQIKK